MATDAEIVLAALLGQPAQGLSPEEAQRLAVEAVRLNHNCIGAVCMCTCPNYS